MGIFIFSYGFASLRDTSTIARALLRPTKIRENIRIII
jgi:hypothetical protein